MPANLPACGLAPSTKALVIMWLFLDLKSINRSINQSTFVKRHKSRANPPTGILAFIWKVRLTLNDHTPQIKRVFTRPLTLYLGKLVLVHLKRCCLLHWSLNVYQYCCMILRLVLLILQSDSRSNLPLTVLC